jgi:hypothetical protein
MIRATRISLAFTLVYSLTAACLAGPLTPPVGPVASTAKPLSEVEPRIAINATNTPGDGSATYRITQPGSYYLTGNLQGEPNKNGIIVASANVTIDLNGFRMFGASLSLDGIVNATGVNIVTVRNGTVAGWRIDINLQSDVTAGEGSEVHSVNVNGKRSSGLLMGNRGRAVNVSAAGNVSIGISIGEGAIVTGCVAALNGGTGISTGPGATVSGSVARQNSANGFLIGVSSSVSGCTAAGNQGDGFAVGSGSSIHNCTSRENAVAGFFINAGSSISNCSAQLNTSHGIEGSADNFIFANACDSNGNGSVGAGIFVTSPMTTESTTTTAPTTTSASASPAPATSSSKTPAPATPATSTSIPATASAPSSISPLPPRPPSRATPPPALCSPATPTPTSRTDLAVAATPKLSKF